MSEMGNALLSGFILEECAEEVVLVLEIIDPASSQGAGGAQMTKRTILFWGEITQGESFLPKRRHIGLFECDKILPLVFLAEIHDRTCRIEGIKEHAKRCLREKLLEPFGQPPKSFEFAVLLLERLAGIFNELHRQRQGQAIAADEESCQYRVLIGDLA